MKQAKPHNVHGSMSAAERAYAESEARRYEAKGPVNVVAVTADARPISSQFDSFTAAAHEVVRWSKDAFYTHGRPLVTVVMSRGEYVTKFDLDSDGEFPQSWQRVWTLDDERPAAVSGTLTDPSEAPAQCSACGRYAESVEDEAAFVVVTVEESDPETGPMPSDLTDVLYCPACDAKREARQ